MKAIETTVAVPFEQAEASVRQALAEQGFGVLTEIDVAATLQAKLGVAWRPMKILGACNPSLAHQALTIDPSVSLLLPCNVVLEATDEGVHVAAADPRELMPDEAFTTLAADAAARLRIALDRIGEGKHHAS